MPIEPTDEFRDEELSRLEGRLQAWRPDSGGLDRDRMLYEAGRDASAAVLRRRLVATSTALAASIVASAVLASAWTLERRRGESLHAELVAARLEADHARDATRTILAQALPSSETARRSEPFSYVSLSRRITESGRIDLEDLDGRAHAPDEPADVGSPSTRSRDWDRMLSL